MPRAKRERILQLLSKTGVLRPRDLEEVGISGVYLNKLYAEGVLDRPSRGLYTLHDTEPSEHRTIAEASKRVPHGIICLLSALRHYDLTTQSPFEVWLAIDQKARLPNIDYPHSNRHRFRGRRHARTG